MAVFHKEEMDEQDQDKNKGRKEPKFDDKPKFMSKVIAGSRKKQKQKQKTRRKRGQAGGRACTQGRKSRGEQRTWRRSLSQRL
jgi:thyroid hormone receptor-associated protein 3